MHYSKFAKRNAPSIQNQNLVKLGRTDFKPTTLPEDHVSICQNALKPSKEGTDHLRAAYGDPKLIYAYHPHIDRDVVCREIVCIKGDRITGKPLYDQGTHTIPYPVLVCEDPITKIKWHGHNDPRIIQWLASCDTHRMTDEERHALVYAEQIKAEKKAEAFKKFTVDLFTELRPQFAKMASEEGHVLHRDTGNDAKKISSAGLWNAGAAAKPSRIITEC